MRSRPISLKRFAYYWVMIRTQVWNASRASISSTLPRKRAYKKLQRFCSVKVAWELPRLEQKPDNVQIYQNFPNSVYLWQLVILVILSLTPLHIACSEGHLEIVKIIMEDIEEKQSSFLSSYINLLDKQKQTALHHAQTLTDDGKRFTIVEYRRVGNWQVKTKILHSIQYVY